MSNVVYVNCILILWLLYNDVIFTILDTDNLDCLIIGFQEAKEIPFSELSDLSVIGQGGFGVVYRAKHGRYGTVVYKELNVQILGERYS